MCNLFKKRWFKILFSGFFYTLPLLISVVHAENKYPTTVAVRAPVWTEEMGKVPLNHYTREELANMVRDFWTPERMKKAIPVKMREGQNFSYKENFNVVPFFC